MNCESIERLIAAEIDGEIGPTDAQALAEHLTDCEACRSLAAACREQDREIREAFAGRVRTAEELADRWAETFRAAPAARDWMSRMALIAAAALVIGFGGGWLAVVSLREPGDTRVVEPAPAPAPKVFPTPEKRVSPPARLAFATGPVDVLPADATQWVSLKPSDPLPVRAQVRCSPETRCELQAGEGSVLRLDRGTQVTFRGVRKWRLDRGRIWTRVVRSETLFEVAVGETIVTALGTRFDVSREEKRSVVQVYEGTTKITTAKSVRVIRRGERAEIADGIAVKKLGHGLARATSWMNDLLILEGRDDTELRQRLEELLAGVGQGKINMLYEDEIRALGDSCVVPLLKYIASPRSAGEPTKRRRAAGLVGELATAESIDDLIELLSDPDGSVRQEMARALHRLTGKDFGRSPALWKNAPWVQCEPTFLRWVEWAESRR